MIILKIKLLKFIFIIVLSFIFIYIGIIIFYPIFLSNNITIYFYEKSLNIFPSNPTLWHILKLLFIISYTHVSVFISTYLSCFIHQKNKKRNLKKSNDNSKNCLKLFIGYSDDNPIYIPELGLYQNILITGTIGTGKTSSAMYPFTEQLISYKASIKASKIGMLILDVKGNYYSKVLEYAKRYNRLDDVIVIELNGSYKYNPLHKPHLKPSVIANQLKSILLLFSPNNSESYWIDKAEEVLCEAIKLCRLYNNGYVTFTEIHKLITEESYYESKVEELRKAFVLNKYSQDQLYELHSSLNFFNKEFFSLDSRTLNILKSEITRITNSFISDYSIKNTFCCEEKKLNFFGFTELINDGKIVVLNMNINEYRNFSKIIAAYLKMDFQTEVMSKLSNNKVPPRTTAFISDEYSEYVTANDANFFSQSREAKCINIIATQSYTSLLNTLNNQYSTKVIIQNLVNKIWFRTDDIFTIEDAQKQIGKTEKSKSSKTISENSQKASYNYLVNSFNSRDSSISESINTYSQFDYIYDTNYFTQNLETFSALCFISDGSKILSPCKINLIPYFKNQK